MNFSQSPQYMAACAFRLPRWAEVPRLGLYMDQLLTYVNGCLLPLADPDGDELLLTKSMVNNYVKQKVLPPPQKKRYSREQAARLLILCALKQVFSIPECMGLMKLNFADGVNEKSYDRFCRAVEAAMYACFRGKLADNAGAEDAELRGLALLFAGKIYFRKRLEYEEKKAFFTKIKPAGI